MRREETIHTAHAFMAALSRRDVRSLLSLFTVVDPFYADPCKPGVSQGQQDVGAHLELLCHALKDAVIIPVDIFADRERACVRWVAELPAPRSHALDAVTILHTLDGAVAEARTFFDASMFLPAESVAGTDALPGGSAVAEGAAPNRPAVPILRGSDSRGRAFDLRNLAGKAVCVLCASRAVQDHAQSLALTLGEHFAGDERVALVVLLDATDVPRTLLPVARSALATLRQGAVSQFRNGFIKVGKPLPEHLEDLVWFIPDYDGRLFRGMGVALPLSMAVLAVVAPDGRLAGMFTAPDKSPAQDAARRCRELLGEPPA